MDVISFARGIPSPDLLPAEELAECARLALERDGAAALTYGPAAGYAPLRAWIADRHGIDASRVVVTTGSLQGFHLVARHFLGGGRRIVVEEPTYDRSLATLEVLGAEVEPVPLTEDGLDLGALARALSAAGPALLYVIPNFQNPTGRTLSLEHRRALAELVAKHDAVLFEDDPYALVRFDGDPLPSLLELVGDRAVYSSSFSKTVAPGLRLGYLVLPEEAVAPVEALALSTYIAPSGLVQASLVEFVRARRFEPNLERIRAELRTRRDAMLAALERELPEATWNEPDGGYFLWLDLPEGVAAAPLLAQATEAGVTFVKGADFYVGDGGEESARLAYSFVSASEIEEGIARLARLVRNAAAVAA